MLFRAKEATVSLFLAVAAAAPPPEQDYCFPISRFRQTNSVQKYNKSTHTEREEFSIIGIVFVVSQFGSARPQNQF